MYGLENDKLLLGANVSATYNSNVLGISKELSPAVVEQALRGRSQGDWIWGYGALARVDLPVSNQRFLLDASATRYDYHQYDELDYTGYAVRGIWNWRVGKDWWGQINAGAAQSRQTYTSGVVTNFPALVKNYDELVDAHYALTPRWEINGALSATQSRYSAVELQSGNFDSTTEAIGAAYRTPLGNSTGVRLTLEQGEWPLRPPVGGVVLQDNTYTQYSLAMVLDWQLTGRSRLSGDIGYTARTRATVGGDDTVDGPSGRLTYNYLLSGKSQLTASLYQIFGPLDDPTASYVKTTGLDAGFSYQATAKLSLQVNARYQHIDYLGQLVATAVQRKDTYGSLGVGAKYQATRTVFFTAGADYLNRGSNLSFAAYDVYTVYVSANLQF